MMGLSRSARLLGVDQLIDQAVGNSLGRREVVGAHDILCHLQTNAFSYGFLSASGKPATHAELSRMEEGRATEAAAHHQTLQPS